MHRIHRILLILSLPIALLSCSKKPAVEHSFYYWKTTFTGDSTASDFIQQHNISHFYIRYFDVDWSNNQWMPVPRAEISGIDKAAPFVQGQYTPVVYITNKTFERMHDNYWNDSLAVKVRNRILFINNKIRQTRIAAEITMQEDDPQEIQIDCDWTETTRDKYFSFLQKLKGLLPGKTISATIRLYPYKYHRKMGVPPVNKGLLMCYNMTNIRHAATTNSVFDIKDLEQYLVPPTKYPLPLDVALPVFGWYAWFSQGSFKGIVYPNEDFALLADTMYFKKTGNNLQVKNDVELNNQYLREGDMLRMEYPKEDALVEAARLLQDKLPAVSRVAFYHYDNTLIKQYEQAIEKVYALY